MQKCIVKIEDLQPDDEWILDDAWDEVYLDKKMNSMKKEAYK